MLHPFGEQPGKCGGDESNAQGYFSIGLAEGTHGLAELVAPTENITRLGKGYLAGWSQAQALGLPNEKRYIPLRFEIFDLAGDCGLRDVQSGRGPTDVGLFGRHDKVT